MASSLLVFLPHEQMHRALSILKQAGIVSPDGGGVKAVNYAMKLIAKSPIAAKVADRGRETQV